MKKRKTSKWKYRNGQTKPDWPTKTNHLGEDTTIVHHLGISSSLQQEEERKKAKNIVKVRFCIQHE